MELFNAVRDNKEKAIKALLNQGVDVVRANWGRARSSSPAVRPAAFDGNVAEGQ